MQSLVSSKVSRTRSVLRTLARLDLPAGERSRRGSSPCLLTSTPRPQMAIGTVTSGRTGLLSESVASSILDQALGPIREDGAHDREPR